MKLNPLVVYQEEFDKSAILFNPATGESFMLNHTASFLWKEFMNGKDEAGAVAALKVACDGGLPPEAEREIEDFIAELRTNGYIAD
ncbi:MAG: PqqD family peptide modification chaperone [Victivallaceae bacterium]|nr:PqqD family peptide modification chaperone [Victivallaceae bacterium]